VKVLRNNKQFLFHSSYSYCYNPKVKHALRILITPWVSSNSSYMLGECISTKTEGEHISYRQDEVDCGC
jgi:hypothetical protein